jgi:prepilin-type N-terminal cleavage/methylation domain-containing protein
MSPRRGFTLVEVLVALVIMGVVTGAIYRLLNTNQRLALAQAEQTSLQSNVRTGSLVVPSELRELNTWLGAAVGVLGDRNDIIVAEDDGIEYRAMRGLGFVCEAPGAGATELHLAESSWTGLRNPDAARDDIYVFIDGDEDDDGDDTWLRVDITAATKTNNACGADPGFELTAAAMPDVPLNTPVRLFEHMELRLYADGGEWWLGARSVNAELVPQPVLGPLTDDGFALEYLNSAGNDASGDLSSIKAVRLTVQGLTDDAVRAHGSAQVGHPEETLVTEVLLRNSIRP